jgi:hypothetical protein
LCATIYYFLLDAEDLMAEDHGDAVETGFA